MEGLERIVLAHPFFAGSIRSMAEVIAGCARNMRFDPANILFHEGDPADEFYLIRHGRWRWRSCRPASRPCGCDRTWKATSSASPGWCRPIAGGSMRAPSNWSARIGVDAKCLRGKCEADNHLGYEMMKRFLPMLVGRLEDARMQMLDVYGTP